MMYNIGAMKDKESQRQNPFMRGGANQMILSDHIASLIEEMLKEGGGSAEVKRNDLAAKIGCVPSQINYVITSRFTPEKGYVIESRRGGGGYIRITPVACGDKSAKLMHVINSIGDRITYADAYAMVKNCFDYDLIDGREAKIIISALNENQSKDS